MKYLYLNLGMDKKMTRQILFKKGEAVAEPVVKKKKPENPVEKPKEEIKIKSELTLQERSKKIYDWLDDKPLINLNGVCIKVGIDRANFVKGMGKNKELKEDVLNKIVAELNQYGYSE